MITIGIDFGTTKTMAAWVNPRTGHPETINLGDEHNYIPTTVFLNRGGNMAFGEEADENATGAPECYARGFKMKLGSNAPALFCISGGKPCMFTARQLTAAFLKHVKTLCEERACFTGVHAAVITRPVDFSPAQEADLRQAAEEAGFTDITLVTEPEAAGYAFCRLSPEHAFSTAALVVDWGGGTLDMALVERSADKVKIRRKYTAGENAMGGEHFDMYLWQYVCTVLSSKGTDLSAQPAAVRHAAQVQVRKAKEALSKRDSKELRLSTPTGPTPPISLLRADFEQLISQDVQKAAAMADRLVQQATSQATGPEMLLLVGGTSLIPLVRQEMESHTGLPARQWQYTREAVAMGAALWLQLERQASNMSAEGLCREGDTLTNQQQYQAAFSAYRASAQGGFGRGMYHLAECYDYGLGTDISKAQAREWYHRAAEKNIADSQPRAQWLDTHPDFVKMVDCQPYNPEDPELVMKRRECREILRAFNASGGDMGILLPLLKINSSVRIAAPFLCDYGENILAGANTRFSQDCLILDSAPVYIGNNVTIGRGVHIYTATHPMKYAERNKGYGLSRSVHIGNNVSIGEMAVICPGVNIGAGAEIEPYTVVRQNIAPNEHVCCQPVRLHQFPSSLPEIYHYSPRDPQHAELRQQANQDCKEFISSESLDILHRLIDMGTNSSITPPFSCEYPGNICIKDGTYINKGCYFDNSAPIIVGSNSIMGPGVRILTSAENPANKGNGVAAPVVIGNNCWICGRAAILSGVTIGDGAVVAAGSIVTESVPANAFVAGTPAHVEYMIEQ